LKDAEKKIDRKDFGPFFFWHDGMTKEGTTAGLDGYVADRGIEFNCYTKMEKSMGYVEEWYEK